MVSKYYPLRYTVVFPSVGFLDPPSPETPRSGSGNTLRTLQVSPDLRLHLFLYRPTPGDLSVGASPPTSSDHPEVEILGGTPTSHCFIPLPSLVFDIE